MKVTIHGPNLHDQSKGDFRVHTEACRDNQKEIRYNGSEGPWTIDADSEQDVAEALYADHIAEGSTTLEGALGSIYFAPCVRELKD